MKEITKEFIMQKMVEKWGQENPDLLEDIHQLAVDLTLFNAKWGARLMPEDFLPSQKIDK